MHRLNKLLLAVMTLLIAAAALGQSTLGNMFKLGVVTTSTRPASSAAIEGALIYDGDAGAPIFNNGTAWKQLVDSSSISNSWYDGGVTYVGPTDPNWPNRTGVIGPQTSIFSDAPIQNADAGALWIGGRNSVGQLATALNIFTDTNGQPTIAFRGTAQNIWGQIFGSGIVNAHTRFGLNLRGGAIGFVNGTTGDTNADTVFGAFDSSTGGYIAEGGSGSYVWSMNNTGARMKFSVFNGSSTDYFAGDGIGIITPGYVNSSYAFATGAGLVAPRIKPTGTTDDNFVAAATGAGSLGSIAYNATTQSLYIQKTSSSFAPIAQPHAVWDAQVYNTRITSGTSTLHVAGVTGPQFAQAEKVGPEFVDDLRLNWDYGTTGSGTPSFLTSRNVYILQMAAVGDGNRIFSHAAASSSLSTVYGLVNSSASPRWAQVIQPIQLTNMRIQAGLTSTVTTAASSTMGVPGVIFRYDTSASDTTWMICSRDATTESCTSSGVTVSAAVIYVLELKLDSSRTIWASINGVSVAKISTNLVPASTALTPWLSWQYIGTPSSIVSLGVGVMQVESL